MENESPVILKEISCEDGTTFTPSEKEDAVVNDTVYLFRETQMARDREFNYFDGYTLIDYIDECVRRYVTNVDERDGIEDWQARVHDRMTANKVDAIHGKVMEVLQIASFTGRSDESIRKGLILSDLYEFTEDLDDYEEFMSSFLLEAIVKGTAIGYEDIEIQNRKYRNVKKYGDNINVDEKDQKITRFYSKVIPLESFYPSSVGFRKVSDLPYAFVRENVPYTDFMKNYGHYEKSKIVKANEKITQDNLPYYHIYIGDDVPEGYVEIIKFFDKIHDQYIIIANGIWINPIETKTKVVDEDNDTITIEGGEDVSPLPWNHKELPFFDVRFSPYGQFFYGKGLPDKLKSMQDVLNVLTNMVLDQTFMSLFPTILANGIDLTEDYELRPGRFISVDTQGIPINSAVTQLTPQPPSGFHQFILEYTRKVMEEASVDKLSQGVAGVGDRVTAQEIRVAASGVASILQNFSLMTNRAIKIKANLRAKNILQFGFNTEAPILRQVLGKKGGNDAKKAFVTFTREGVVLSDGKRGTRIVEIFAKDKDVPTKTNVNTRAMFAKKERGTEVEIVSISPEYLRDYNFDIKTELNPRSNISKNTEKALQLEKVQVYRNFFGDTGKLNLDELAAQTALVMGDDPSVMFQESEPTPEAQVPGSNASSNIMEQLTGTGGNELQQLKAAMAP